ncbi:bifunctional UDP-N-acetylglucosamine diphosphorylase/glucosamine-1-phosphate N-acetyltransferase GlmU [Candidatus Providencia siddallii]|uniref:Bifunctional protein GlmU n=1 Tax=Candidatus Providencia siddallii TaxID=1715285 RepID=A0ABM9NN86_9GAMM
MISQKKSVVILAAGIGIRMRSKIPKVFHFLAGKPIIQYVIETAKSIVTSKIYLVHGLNGDFFKKKLKNETLNWILQKKQLGTGHAMQQVAQNFQDDEDIIILYGDVPLITKEILERLIKIKPNGGIGLLTVILDNPTGYGRIIRKNNNVISIIEQSDITEEYCNIKEVNTGIMVANGKDLKRWLKKINNNNFQKEYYLTDIINISYREGNKIMTIHPNNISETYGVNSKLDLTILERIYQKEQAEKLLLNGVMLIDPNRVEIRGKLTHGIDVTIDINVIIEGNVILGNNVYIQLGCILKNCIIGDNTIIKPYTIIDSSELSEECVVGPFAQLRPGTKLAAKSYIGNFVEIKNSSLGLSSKIGHLSYIGDAQIGNNVNIGAGTITCNFDGVNKHKTIIGDNVFIGSDSQLIAPISISKGATIGAGTTVVCDVNNPELILSRTKQIHIKNWRRPIKKK